MVTISPINKLLIIQVVGVHGEQILYVATYHHPDLIGTPPLPDLRWNGPEQLHHQRVVCGTPIPHDICLFEQRFIAHSALQAHPTEHSVYCNLRTHVLQPHTRPYPVAHRLRNHIGHHDGFCGISLFAGCIARWNEMRKPL